MAVDPVANAMPCLFRITALCLLVISILTYSGRASAAPHMSCSISALKNLMALDGKGFEVRKESLSGYSSEGGTLTILSRKASPQRARAELFGETGRIEIEVGNLDGDLMAIIRWIDYAASLPAMPVRTKKIDTMMGFACSSTLILDRQESSDIRNNRVPEFEQLMSWLLNELKIRGITWNPRAFIREQAGSSISKQKASGSSQAK